MDFTHISLAHGNGGRFTRELIEQLFVRYLHNPLLDIQSDAVVLPLALENDVVITTDGFTVQPLEFPHGTIGSLAIHGTINDLAVVGATPRYITLNAFIEEGMEIQQLERIIQDLSQAAQACGVVVVAGDTKVVRRGEGSGLYLATTGIGIKSKSIQLGTAKIQAGDCLLVSGSVGDHGIAVLLAREQFGLHGQLASDSASVLPITQKLLQFNGLRFMRDPTRGGLATVTHEICAATGFGVDLTQVAIPIHESVQAVCDMLGYDPLYLACEGRVVAVIAAEEAAAALQALQQLPQGGQAALIGQITAAHANVVLNTPLGGRRFLEELEDDPLPRIC